MPFGRFLPYNLAGAVVYCSSMVYLAYFSAPFIDRAVHLIALANHAVALLMLMVGLGLGLWLLSRQRVPSGSRGKAGNS